MLSVGSPLWAWGALAAVGLPVLAHLLSRARYREAWFPATRLVRQAVVATTRVERPRHLLLMMLRVLALLLIVSAFMRPRWVPEAGAQDAERGVSLVVLLDASASMQRVRSGATLHDRARREAEVLIGGLDPSGDVASVVVVDGSPQALYPEPTAQFAALRERVRASRAGYEAADWPGAVAAAARRVEAGPRRVRVVVLSDQQGDWPAGQARRGALQGAAVDHRRIDGPGDNTAVRLLDVTPYPPVAGRPVSAVVEVSNFRDQPHRATLRATLGEQAIERTVDLDAGGTRRVEVALPAPGSGVALLRVALQEPDAMPADDRAGAVLAVQARPGMLVVYGEGSGRDLAERVGWMASPGEGEGEGRGAGERAGEARPRVELADFDAALKRVDAADPSRLRTVVVLEPQAIDAALRGALQRFAERGGGVVGLSVGGSAGQARGVSAAAVDFTLAPLRVFEGPSRAGLTALRWRLPGDAELAEGHTALLRAADGRPIVSVRPVGRGRWVRVHAALDRQPGGLLAEPAFVVLFNELCRYASPGPALPAPARPGEALPDALRNAERLSIPDDAEPVSGADRARITAPGAYLVTGPGGELRGGVFAELAPSESDTTPGEPWGSRTASGDAGRASSNRSASASAVRPRVIELWPYLVLAAVVLMAGESSLLWRFSRAAGGRS